MKESRSRLEKSPYFSNARPTLISPISKEAGAKIPSKRCRSRPRSDYFLKAPSSAHGAVASLGPLLLTWTSKVEYCNFDFARQCERRRRTEDAFSQTDDSTSSAMCTTCQPIIDNALRRFEACPVFQTQKQISFQRIPSDMNNTNKFLSCVEMVDKVAQQQLLRHLCDNQCYLRGFAPQRDWLALRQLVQEHSTQSLDILLKDWTCCLALEGNGEVVDQVSRVHPRKSTGPPSGHHSRSQPRKNPACTEFVSKTSAEVGEKVFLGCSILE
jgi:hypothetical protein